MLPNPKRSPASVKSELYAYYAGFSCDFVRAVLKGTARDQVAIVLDPWNGTGTTTRVAQASGYCVRGFDINPVMVLVAKVGQLDGAVRPSAQPIGEDLVRRAGSLSAAGADPLLDWFRPSATAALRGIELAIRDLLLPSGSRTSIAVRTSLEGVSPIAALYYTALFRVLRRLTTSLRCSNPAWLRLNGGTPLAPTRRQINTLFLKEVAAMESTLSPSPSAAPRKSTAIIDLGHSAAIPVSARSIDLVLSSPPYCTRIDYAVATRTELALLGFDKVAFRALRESMIGTPTVSASSPSPSARWGRTCNAFLSAVRTHPSKASAGYYSKVFLTYFDGLFRSLGDIERVLKDDGLLALVVQDSHYKTVYNDLPAVTSEMASAHGFRLLNDMRFQSTNPLRNINTRSQAYRPWSTVNESVLLFRKD